MPRNEALSRKLGERGERIYQTFVQHDRRWHDNGKCTVWESCCRVTSVCGAWIDALAWAEELLNAKE